MIFSSFYFSNYEYQISSIKDNILKISQIIRMRINQQFTLITKLLANIKRAKCLLIIGPASAGKTVLIKHYQGIQLYKLQNEQHSQLLGQNQQQLKGNSLQYGIQIDFAWLITSEQILVIQIPDIFTLNFESANNSSEEQSRKFLLGMFLWCSLTILSQQIGINIVIPFEYSIDHTPLINFFRCWESLLNTQSDFEKIKASIVITLTKLEYQEDSEQFHPIFKGLCDGTQEGISENPSFYPAADQFFIFLQQSTNQKEGPQLLQKIQNKIKFISPQKLFANSHYLMLINQYEQKYSKDTLQSILTEYEPELLNDLLLISSLFGRFFMMIYFYKNKKLEIHCTSQMKSQTSQLCNNLLFLVKQDVQSNIQALEAIKLDSKGYQNLANMMMSYYQWINKPDFNNNLLLDYIRQLQEILFKSDVSKNLLESEIFQKLQALLKMKIEQLHVFLVIDSQQINEKAQNKYFKQLENNFLEGCKVWKISSILRNKDEGFQQYQRYEKINQILKQTEQKQDNDEDEEDSGQDYIEKIKRVYTKNKVNQKIKQFLQSYQEKKIAKPESVNQISKLFLKIQKQADNIKFIDELLKKLEEYKQYQFYIDIEMNSLGRLPDQKILRRYFQQIKKSIDANRFEYLRQKVIPFTLENTIISDNYDFALQSQKILRKCMDFISIENDVSRDQHQNSQKIAKKLPYAQKFVYDKNDQPEQKKITTKFEINKETKAQIKKNMDTKMKLYNKNKPKVDAIISYFISNQTA